MARELARISPGRAVNFQCKRSRRGWPSEKGWVKKPWNWFLWRFTVTVLKEYSNVCWFLFQNLVRKPWFGWIPRPLNTSPPASSLCRAQINMKKFSTIKGIIIISRIIIGEKGFTIPYSSSCRDVTSASCEIAFSAMRSCRSRKFFLLYKK